MQRVNEADTAAGRNPRNRLREFQVRIHPRRRIEKKHPQQFRGLAGIAIIAGDPAGRPERGHRITQPAKRQPMLVKIRRIRQTVALEVRQAVGFCRVGPPVVAI